MNSTIFTLFSPFFVFPAYYNFAVKKEIMNKKQVIYLTDLLLIPLFILAAYTGLELHIAGHGTNHEIWHSWAVFHTLISFMFSTFEVMHIATHWSWYKGLKRKGIQKKSKPVLILTSILILVTITGVWLLIGIEGSNTPMGVFHYTIGLIMSVQGILHVLKRWRFYTKNIVF